ncbi:hypothetical protein R1sor_011758 [Riccia sorocarpa]|uniref:Uncharacterized protein n=1 Tax=Riccia sorocarpa TaxID=122646 RepID=A0ABD3I1T3_9MARC
MILLMVVILGPSNIHLIGRALLAAYLPPLFTVFSAAEVDPHDICYAVTNETAVRDSPSRLALSPKLTSVDLPAWSSSPSGATVPTSTLLRSDSATSWVMGIDTAILIHNRNPDLQNVGQIDDKHAAIAALCEDGMECLQKRVAALEKELEETLHELMEARLDIFKKQVQMDDDSRRHSDELDRLSQMMSILNKDVSTLSKKLDVALASRRAAANVISVTREKLTETEARCREVLNENHIAHDRLLAELGRPLSAPSMWEL